MNYLNGQLQMLADRQDVERTLLRWAFEADLGVWVWPAVGVRGTWLGSFGALRGRTREPLSATALGAAACVRLPPGTGGMPVSVEAGVGAYLVSVSGLVTGDGVAWGGHLAGAITVVSGGSLVVEVRLGLRYLPVRQIGSGREIVAPDDGPAVDFSGISLGVTFGWRI